MKKIIILGRNAIAKHIGMSILIILQTVCILVGSNILLASYQQQFTLVKPFSKWLDSDGYYVIGLDETGSNNKTLFESLEGEWERVQYYRETTFNMYDNNKLYPIKVLVYDNEFWDNYSPLLKKGKWQKSDIIEDSPWCIATPNMFGTELLLPDADTNLKVNGIMGDLCYIPLNKSWSKNGSIAENFYSVFSTKRDETINILMPESQWNQLGLPNDILYSPRFEIIISKHELSDEAKSYNDKIFKEFGEPAIPMSTLNLRAKADIKNRLQRFLPLLLAQLTITLFGLLCVSAIQTLSDEKTFSIFGLCGMNRKKRLLINLSEYGLLLIISCSITYIVYFVTKNAGMHTKYGLLFSMNNLILSAVLVGLLLLISITAPFIITRNKRLADQLRRETE